MCAQSGQEASSGSLSGDRGDGRRFQIGPAGGAPRKKRGARPPEKSQRIFPP